ncbi:MAG: nucleoside kinase, partial [Lachnospiraceae bacterium]|nr:nucleoside kinase [Lachnospiraceae bacterium]
MANVWDVSVNGKVLKFEDRTTFLEIAKQLQPEYSDDIVLAKYNGKLKELWHSIHGDGELELLTTKSSAGRKCYRRSATMLMQRGLYNLDPNLHVEVRYSISQGYFCKLCEDKPITDEFLQALKAEMEKVVKQDLPIRKSSYDTSEAKRIFQDVGMQHKGNLFKYRSSSKVSIYSIGHYMDYYYGYMVPSTGYLKYFDLVAYDDGFVLMFPNEDSHKVAEFNPPHKLYATLKEATKWGKMLGVSNIGELNDAIAAGHGQELILV